MSEKEKTDIQESETPEEKETPETTETETDEGSEPEGKGDGEDVEKEEQEEDYYAKEAKRLEAELEEERRQKEIKDRALQAEKKKRKEAERKSSEPKGDLDEEALLAKLEARQNDKLVKQRIKREFSDPNAQKLIEDALDNRIVKTGDPEEDYLAAVAYANRKRLPELLGREQAEHEQEDRAISSMLGEGTRPTRSRVPKSQLRKEAEKGLPKEMHKHLDKYLK